MSKVAIRVGETWLELPSNFVFSQTKKTPLYLGQSINFIPGNYTLPVNIDASPANRTALGYRDFVDNPLTFSAEIQADVYLFGNFYERGRLIVKTANPREFRIQFMSGAGELQPLADKSLRDYDFGDIVLADGIAYLYHQQQVEENPEDYDHLIFHTYTEHPPLSEDGEPFLTLRRVINMYVMPVIETVLTAEGFEFSKEIFGFWEDRLLLFFPRIFPYEEEAVNFQKNTAVPPMSPAALITNIAKLFCWCFYVDSYTRKVRVFKQSSILTAQAVDRSARVAGEMTRSEASFQIKEFKYEYETGEADFHERAKDFAGYVYAGTATTITELGDGEEGQIKYVYSLSGYVLHTGEIWDVENPFQNLENLKIGTEGVTIDSKIKPLYMKTKDGIIKPIFRGTYYYSGNNVEPSESAGILTYLGMQPNGNGIQSSLISPYPHNYAGQNIANISLEWDGFDGLYNKNWKSWAEFLAQSERVEVDMHWTENDLRDSDLFLKPMALYDAHSGTTQKYLLTDMKIVVGMTDGLRVSTQKLIQMRHEVSRGKHGSK